MAVLRAGTEGDASSTLLPAGRSPPRSRTQTGPTGGASPAKLRTLARFPEQLQPGGVIDRAVVDRIAVDGQRHPEMIPMGAVHHVLVAQFGVAPGSMPRTFRLSILRIFGCQIPFQGHAQWDWAEVARIGRSQEFVDRMVRQRRAVSRRPPVLPIPQTRAGSAPVPRASADLPCSRNSEQRPTRSPPLVWCE